MEMAGLLSLPVEVLHNISRYLAVKDILNFSETCCYLQMAFNANTIWRKFVPEKVLQLKTQQQLVEPAFKWEDILTPLCDYRVHYMRLTHLLNNWNFANFVKYSTKTQHSYASGVFDTPKGRGKVFYKDRYLFLGRFINDIESDRIEIWDVGKEPVLHSFVDIKNINYDCFYIIGSNLVVVECEKVCVYQINLPDNLYPLLYSFIIPDTEATWNEDVHRERCDFRCVGWKNYNISQFLVCNKCGDDGEGSVVHVWDIVNAKKVGAFVLPMDAWSVNVVAHEENEWLLRAGIQSSNLSFYFLFNIEEKTFSETGLQISEYPKQMTLYKSNILYMVDNSSQHSDGDTIFVVYDLKTSTEVKKRHFIRSRIDCLSTLTIFNGYFICLISNSCQIVNALTLETVDGFQCEIDIGLVIHHYNVFGSPFLMVLSENIRNRSLCIWNVSRKDNTTRPLQVVYRSHLYLNSCMTKLVTVDYNEVNVLHFW